MPSTGPPDGGSCPDEGRNGTACIRLVVAPPLTLSSTRLPSADVAGSLARVTDSAAVLDLDQLRAAFGDIDDDVRDLLRLFVDSTRPILDDLERSIGARDQAAAENEAHSAKGAARSAGAMAMAAVCERLEVAARAGDWSAVERERAAVRPAFAAAAAAILDL
jgi:two-component system, sensor histidine kinase and response regulator